MKVRQLAVVTTLLASAGACGYYNSMYNANRLFADAEKANARGEVVAARSAYEQSIEKATTSITRHPGSRWRDDARLLVARAHLRLGDPFAAQARLLELLNDRPDADRRAAATMYLGVIAAELGDDANARLRLNAALGAPKLDSDLRTTGMLARAGVHYRARDWEAARADTRAARQKGNQQIRLRAAFLELRIALAARDSVRTMEAWTVVLREPAAQRWTDSLQALSQLSAATFSPALAHGALATVANAPWRSSARDSLLLARASLIMQSGDTAGAIKSAERIAARTTGPMADAARIRAAEWRLARSTRLEELPPIRNDLLPAIAHNRARALVQTLKTIEVLAERAQATGQPLALFAAAELARDELQAPALAAKLFLTYAELAPQTAWTPKALLAASALDSASAAVLHDRVQSLYADNPYVAAAQGRGDPSEFHAAEERLARSLSAIVSEAALVAAQRENTVNRAVAVIDSLRLVARNDSIRIGCGIMLDSLALAGIRADSVRAACLRGDQPRVALLLKADTVMLRDSTRIRADSLARNRRLRRDTTSWR